MAINRPTQSASSGQRQQESLAREHYLRYSRGRDQSPRKGLAEWFRRYANQLYKEASAKLFKLRGAKHGKLPYYSLRRLDHLLKNLEQKLRDKTNKAYEKALTLTRSSSESLLELKEKIFKMGEGLQLALRVTAESTAEIFNVVRTLETGTKKEYINSDEVARLIRLNGLFQKAIEAKPRFKKELLSIVKQIATGEPLKPKHMKLAFEIAKEDLNRPKLENSILLSFMINAMNTEQIKQFLGAMKKSPENQKNVVKFIRMLTVIGKLSIAEGEQQIKEALRDSNVRRRTSKREARNIISQFSSGEIAKSRQKIQDIIHKHQKKFKSGRYQNFFDLAWGSGAIFWALAIPIGALIASLNQIMGNGGMALTGVGIAAAGALGWHKGTQLTHKPGMFSTQGPIGHWIFRDKEGVRIEEKKVKYRRVFINLKKNQPTFHNYLSHGGLQDLVDWKRAYQSRVQQVNRGRRIGTHPRIIGGSVHPRTVMQYRLKQLNYKNLVERLKKQGKHAQVARIEASLRQFPGNNTAEKTRSFNNAIKAVITSSKALNIRNNRDLQRMSAPIRRTRNQPQQLTS